MQEYQKIPKSMLKYLSKLNQKKFRKEFGLFIIEGEKIMAEALNSDWNLKLIVASDDFILKSANLEIFEAISKKNIELFSASNREISKITDTVTPPGILAAVEMKNINLSYNNFNNQNTSIIVALDGISDAGNLGTIIRTCDWFKTDLVLIGKNSVELFNPKVIRSTMGSIFHIPIITDLDLQTEIIKLKEKGYRIYTTELDSDPVENIEFAERSVLILGNESHGIDDTLNILSDKRISINNYGRAESLNVAVAGGIFLFHYRIKMNK